MTKLKRVSEEKYLKGTSIGRSKIPVKDPWFAQIKSCNYLHNVLMKKESVDNGWDFSVSFDAKGFVCESATENIAIVSQKNELLFPPFSKTLKGTTLVRLATLAHQLISQGLITAVKEIDISFEQLQNAKEMMMVGTTLNALPVTLFEGKAVGSGQVGRVAQACRQLLREDIEISEMVTVF